MKLSQETIPCEALERRDCMNRTNHYRGKEHPSYKTGIADFIRFREGIAGKEKHCNRCNKDLTNVSRYEWVVHHKDHDRTHNTPSNFEILCKKCHQLEHQCRKNLPHEYHKVCDICGCEFISTVNNGKYCSICQPIYRRWKHRFSVEYIRQKVLEYGRERVTTIPKGSTLK